MEPTVIEKIAAVLADTTMGRHFLATYPVPRAARGYVDDAAIDVAEAVAAEREACAGTVDELVEACNDPYLAGTLAHAAAAIRNRGETS